MLFFKNKKWGWFSYTSSDADLKRWKCLACSTKASTQELHYGTTWKYISMKAGETVSEVTSKKSFTGIWNDFSHGCCVIYLTNQFWLNRMKDCDTIQGGEGLRSKVITSGCYSFMVLSHPDSSTISGKDLSCPNKIISQVSWLRRTSRRVRVEDWVPGGSWYRVVCLASHHRQCGCSDGEGMSLLGEWENWSSETVPAWKILPHWNNSVSYIY